MSDTPTTAKEVIEGWFLSGYRADYLAECLNSGTVPDDSWEPHAGMRSQARANAEQLAALVRSSPAVLADLNGGEWVGAGILINGIEFIPADLIPVDGFAHPPTIKVEAVHRFVPREATDGND